MMPIIDYDPKTLRAIFGKPVLPMIPVSLDELFIEARKSAGKLSISGVQPKLSMRLDNDRLIPTVRNGEYILKPQTQDFPQLPENEYLCMLMGKRFGLNTALFILLELSDGTPAYVVKRFDRFKINRRIEKCSCEDMHQIIGGSNKYAGSHEQIAKAIREHCSCAPLELQRLFEMTIFNFAIGNGDAHRKNFSVLTRDDGIVALSPVYDLVSSRLVLPEESKQMALSINGRNNRLEYRDFMALAENLDITPQYAEERISALLGLRDELVLMIRQSLLKGEAQEQFVEVMDNRLNSLKQ